MNLLLKIISYKLVQLFHHHSYEDSLPMHRDVGAMKAPTLQICKCGVTRIREVLI